MKVVYEEVCAWMRAEWPDAVLPDPSLIGARLEEIEAVLMGVLSEPPEGQWRPRVAVLLATWHREDGAAALALKKIADRLALAAGPRNAWPKEAQP